MKAFTNVIWRRFPKPNPKPTGGGPKLSHWLQVKHSNSQSITGTSFKGTSIHTNLNNNYSYQAQTRIVQVYINAPSVKFRTYGTIYRWIYKLHTLQTSPAGLMTRFCEGNPLRKGCKWEMVLSRLVLWRKNQPMKSCTWSHKGWMRSLNSYLMTVDVLLAPNL